MSPPSRARDLAELILGYGLIVGIIWTPEHLQRFLSPIALLFTLSVVLARRHSRDELGMGWRGLIPSLWILPAAVALAALSTFVAAKIGTLHPLYKADFAHVSGYVLWTMYQQFLLQDYFMDRLLRLVSNEAAAVTLAGTALRCGAPAQSRAHRRDAGLGHRVVRALPPLSQPLGTRPGPGTARPLLRHLRAGCAASSPARRVRLPAVRQRAADSVREGAR